MTDIVDKVNEGLSELRTGVLGAQILLGFQYQALFQPRFDSLPFAEQTMEAASYLLLFATVALLLAPIAFHRIAERGESTEADCGVITIASSLALIPFAGAVGLNVAMVTSTTFGAPFAAAFAGFGVLLALCLWFGLEALVRRPRRESHMSAKPAPIDQRIKQMLEESRIVLPGVQALLGFQFAAYLTEPFQKLPAASKLAHTAGLMFLLVAMILLMTPGPFHRLAERGESTPRLDRVGVGLVLTALVPLALAVACDGYVVLERVFQAPAPALAAAGAGVIGCGLLWFAWPLMRRRAPRSELASRAAAE